MPMDIWKTLITLASAYLLGAVPFGFIIVKAFSGKDIRLIGSGRTGGTNAGRAAGFLAGVITAIMDFAKAAMAVTIARYILPDFPWVSAVAGILAIAGHNYSIHLLERDQDGTVILRGGAGGAPFLGAAVGLFTPTLWIVLPIVLVALLILGYASVATLSIGISSTIIFLVRAIDGVSPWEYVGFAIGGMILLVIALIPNIRRLVQGTERVVGLRAWLRKKKQIS